MADEQTNIQEIGDLPPEARSVLAAKAAGEITGAMTLEQLLADDKSAAAQVRQNGVGQFRSHNGQDYVVAADLDSQGHVVAFAAGIPRSAGKSINYINSIDDFATDLVSSVQDRWSNTQTYHRVYSQEGVVNNAINKMASLVAPKGAFKVRSAKGTKGKSGDKRAVEAEQVLNWWKDNVNARQETGLITGDRGVTSFVLQGARLAMIEGDHIARHFWPKQQQVVPNVGNYTLPMNLQTFSVQHIYVPPGLEVINFDILYWQPPKTLVSLVTSSPDKNVQNTLKKILGSDVISQIQNTGRYYLDPALMIHIKHRGTGISMFGQSLIEPALASIRYRRALDSLELAVISNVIARLVIVMVGSDNENSVYHKQEVSSARLGLLQRMMRLAGPAATVLWAGPDIQIKQVSAHDALPSGIVERFQMAERRILMDIGVPSVLLIGEGGDGKAVSFAAALSVAGMLSELQEQYAQALKSLAEVIGTQNGFDQLDVTWEWEDNILDNKEAAATMILQWFQAGLFSSRSALEQMGLDADAEMTRQQEDVSNGVKQQVFGPPLGAMTTNPGGVGGDTGGRPTNTGTPDPRANKEQVAKPGNNQTGAPQS